MALRTCSNLLDDGYFFLLAEKAVHFGGIGNKWSLGGDLRSGKVGEKVIQIRRNEEFVLCYSPSF